MNFLPEGIEFFHPYAPFGKPQWVLRYKGKTKFFDTYKQARQSKRSRAKNERRLNEYRHD